jgi:DNA-directed RNA polymerase delta subunit
LSWGLRERNKTEKRKSKTEKVRQKKEKKRQKKKKRQKNKSAIFELSLATPSPSSTQSSDGRARL